MNLIEEMNKTHQEEMAKLRHDLEFWRRAQIVAYALGSIAFAILSVWLLSSCAPTNPQSEPPFIGTWEAQGPGGAVSLRFDEGGQYLAAFVSPLDTASEVGKWFWREPYLITSPTECREGFALRLMLCEGPDSVLVAIDGDEWPIRFSTNEVTTLYRIHHK